MFTVRLAVASALAVSVLTVAAPSYAAGRGACRKDAAKFCSDVPLGGGRIMACLESHQAELSPECQENLVTMREKEALVKACRPDSQKFCSDVQIGGGRILACLKSHETELSPECKSLIVK